MAGTISEALELAGPGDEIIVSPSYDSRVAQAVGKGALTPEGAPESFPLRVEKAEIKISCQALPGWGGGGDRPRIFAPPDHAAIVIAADGVVVEGCAIRSGGVGIVAVGVSDVKIIDNLLHSLGEGVRLINTSGSIIWDNRFSQLRGVGIHLEGSEGNFLQGNRVERSGEGLFLVNAADNQVNNDRYLNNDTAGVHIESSSGNLLGGLTVSGNGGVGLLLVNSDRNKIIGGEISHNRGGGIVLLGSDDNEIRENRVDSILLSSGELVSFSTPILDPQTGPLEMEDPYAEARQGEAELRAKLQELSDWIIGLGRDFMGMMEEIEPSPVQTLSTRLPMNLQDALDKAVSIKEAAIPLAVQPLLAEAEDGAKALRGKGLGPNEEEILEELESLLELLDEADHQLDRVISILDDGEREAHPEEFDDVMDWLEWAISSEGKRREALEGARRKLEAALIQSGRIGLKIDEMFGLLRAIGEKLPPPPAPDFRITGVGTIGEIVAASVPDERAAEFEGELVERLRASGEVLLKAERLGLLPLDRSDLKRTRHRLAMPSGNVILGNSIEGGLPGLWGGEHRHRLAGLVRAGCLDRRARNSGMERGACGFPTEMVLLAEVGIRIGGVNGAFVGGDERPTGGTGLSVDRISVYPNPVRGADLVRFSVEGRGIALARLRVFDLAGREIFSSGWERGGMIEWHLRDRRGWRVANGVYLYMVAVRGLDGESARGRVEKLVVLK